MGYINVFIKFQLFFFFFEGKFQLFYHHMYDSYMRRACIWRVCVNETDKSLRSVTTSHLRFISRLIVLQVTCWKSRLKREAVCW